MAFIFRISVSVLFLSMSVISGIQGQSFVNQSVDEEQTSLPTVFLLGEYDIQYETIMPTYQTLLEACEGNMENAFNKLTSMMLEMEAYSNLTGYDLKGINAWMHFFWDKDGRIEHIGFHLKPNSRNVDLEKLQNFLNDFASNYSFPLSGKSNFSHYSSFAFPLNYANAGGKNSTGN